AEPYQPPDLRVDVAVGGDQVRVVAVLAALAVRGRLQPDAQLAGPAGRRTQVGATAVIVGLDPVAEGLGPERRHPVDVVHVKGPLVKSTHHGARFPSHTSDPGWICPSRGETKH